LTTEKEAFMALKDTPCPNVDSLQGLLDGSVAADRQAEMTGHLDVCPPCQQALEELAAGSRELPEVIRHVDRDRPSSNSAFWHAVDQLEREVTASAARTTLTPTVQADTDEVPLDFLGPTDTPGMLGKLGDFDVVEVIGRGGMGLVLKGYDGCLQRHVALKVLDPKMAKNETARQRFCREARAAAQISHSHVLAVYQVQEEEASGLPFLVMQLVNGESLQERLDRQGAFDARDVLRIGVQAAMGLAAAHQRGLIHRDIKPANILLADNNHVLLTDFGLARAYFDAKLTDTGFVAGTTLYMSPEQARGEEVDHRSDLFSLGGVLYAMCTGQAPFAGSTPYLILKRVTEEAPRPIREVNPAIPESLAAVVEKLLAKNPEDRPQAAAEVVELLVQQFCVASTSTPAAVPTAPATGRKGTVPHSAGDLLIRKRTLAIAVPVLLLGGVLLSQLSGLRRMLGPELGESGPQARVTLSGNAGPVWSAAFGRDGNTLAMAIDDGNVKLWDSQARRVQHTLEAHRGPVWSIAFSPDGKYLATTSDDGTAKLWDTATWEEQASLKHGTSVRSVAFAPNGEILVTGSRDGSVRIWDVATRLERVTTKGHTRVVMAVAFSPDSKTIASASGDKSVKLWDTATGLEQLSLEGHNGGVYTVAFAPDGKTVASGGWDKTVRLWDVNSGSALARFRGHSKDVWAVAYAPDGKKLDSASEDETVKIWDIPSGREAATLRGHTGTLYTVAYSRDGSTVASGGRDGTVKLWDAALLR
jgi:eukaryotic-like serine/threonine-protein kinase